MTEGDNNKKGLSPITRWKNVPPFGFYSPRFPPFLSNPNYSPTHTIEGVNTQPPFFRTTISPAFNPDEGAGTTVITTPLATQPITAATVITTPLATQPITAATVTKRILEEQAKRERETQEEKDQAETEEQTKRKKIKPLVTSLQSKTRFFDCTDKNKKAELIKAALKELPKEKSVEETLEDTTSSLYLALNYHRHGFFDNLFGREKQDTRTLQEAKKILGITV